MKNLENIQSQFYNLEWMREILQTGHMGLWTVEVDIVSDTIKMYVDSQMQELMGLGEETNPVDTFRFLEERVEEDSKETVQVFIRDMILTGKLIEAEYVWSHPFLGAIFVRCTGKVYGREGTVFRIRGLHQNITEVMNLKKSDATNERKLRETTLEKDRYNLLFESVLCGIVQYRIDKRGVVGIKSANREAIRIFGYEPEEFWDKKDWDIRELIAWEDRKRIMDEILQLKKIGDKQFFEYRFVQKNGSYCWIIGTAEVIDSTGEGVVIQSVYLNENKRKEAELQNKLLEQQVDAGNALLKMALEHTSIYEFYYIPSEHAGHIPERTRAVYSNCRAVYEDMEVSFAREFLAPEYRQEYRSMFEQIHCGEKTATGEFMGKDGNSFRRITLSTLRYDEEGAPAFVVGIDEDITKEKDMEKALLNARTRDSLTGLYTRETGMALIKAHMESKSSLQVCAIMILDMDDYSRVNKDRGIVFGNVILQEVADILKNETGEDDIQLRLGGDEFMIYVKDCDKAGAGVLGPRIAERVRWLTCSEDEDFHTSVSIGMCVTAVVDEYSGLYRCAESTLQYVKEHGKGTAACYLDTSNELGTMLTALYPNSVLINDIDSSSSFMKGDIISFALELLGKAKNMGDAIHLLLARVGKQFCLRRVMIFEASFEYQTLKCSYQWVSERTDRFLDQVLYLSKEDMGGFADLYDGEGLSEKLLNQDERIFPSIIHSAFWNEGSYAGAMCFEMGTADYQWTESQKRVLKELAKLVSSFIMKVRADAVSQAKSDFLSRMSHEIRTPMNAITGMTAIAKNVLEDRERTMDCLNKIESANAYLVQLINDILDMSRIETGKVELNYEPVDLSVQLKDLEAMMNPQASMKRIHLTIRNEYEQDKRIETDSLRLNQILVNIIGNAIKFTGEDGRISLRVEQLEKDSQRVKLRFSVKDNGIGISKERQHYIFNAFEQADKSTASKYGGTGLGLSISSRLVQLMGGTLEVESEPQKGSEFFFSLEFSFEEDAPEAVLHGKNGREAIKHDFMGRRILIAEDNVLNREIAVTLLEMRGFDTEEAVDGYEALEAYLNHPAGYFDIILMDIQMPRMDGLQTTKAIRTSEKRDSRIIPIVAMSANAFTSDTKKSMESGMNGHLVKPIEMDKVEKLLAECISNYDRVREGVAF